LLTTPPRSTAFRRSAGLGIGLGWRREEIEAGGGPSKDRPRFLEESVATKRALWTREQAAYEGELVRFDEVRLAPPPARRGGIPILVSARTRSREVRRAACRRGFIPHPPDARSDSLVSVMRGRRRQAAIPRQ
jgi:alkanesulfonate monooxygenase SsuD/methylene tetrahydromethanopterin reductase-like flavin-dependent oxidoreductase (luciferase family)